MAAANRRMALAALVLLAATETGSGSGTPSPFPPTDVVPWDKNNLKGAFKNGAKAAVAGNALLLSHTASGGSVVVWGTSWAGGPSQFGAEFGMDMSDTNGKAGLQVIFNATGPNNGAVEIDIFARSNGTGIDVTGGQFGGAPPAMQSFPGADCISLKAEREGDGDVALSASTDGVGFTPVFTFPAGSIPAPVEGTMPAIVSVASHGADAGTAIEVGPPTKSFPFGTGAMKEAIDAIELARTLEGNARSSLRKGNPGLATNYLIEAGSKMSQAIYNIKNSPYAKTVPGKAAMKALTSAQKLDAEANSAAATDPGAARGKLNEAEKFKVEALAQLRKL